ncbi:MAG TPA: MBL fold metallo-hydrolase [Burkholderiaceae bacterium]|nr:MBL fold metallo-hydrolase [Burkholderiaceae bacterium]
MPAALIRSFFDTTTHSVTHVVADPLARRAAIIDPVLDYDPHAGRTSTTNADAVIAYVREAGLTVDWLLETHAHADHLSAAPYLKAQLGGRLAIGAHIVDVQRAFRKLFNGAEIATDGTPFEHLFTDDEHFAIGALDVHVLHTPGHTPGCVSYCVHSDAGLDVFIGDTLFMPDYGTARCDFPGGDAAQLFRSVQRLLALPDDARLHLCHDYPPGARAPCSVSTVAEQRRANVHVHAGIDEAAFIAMREARDRTLGKPALLLPAIQVNVRAGQWPAPEDNGVRYLKIPLNAV